MKKANVSTVKGLNKKIETIVQSEESKSSKMKQLFDLGIEVKEIATIMSVRYNFVYNVISNYTAMNSIETVSTKKVGKKEKIIELHQSGKSNKEISIELKTNYNYVFNVLKQYKAEQVNG